MKYVIICSLLLAALNSQAQNKKKKFEHKGFYFGVGVGMGQLKLSVTGNQPYSNRKLSASFPNLKFGYMVGKRIGIHLLLPGATYKYQGKDRGFEGVLLCSQYFLTKRFYTTAGIGLTFDAPAFYTVKDPKTASFYTGFPALTWGGGYEVLRKGRSAVDLQVRHFYGVSNLMPGNRTGNAVMFLIGLNWY